MPPEPHIDRLVGFIAVQSPFCVSYSVREAIRGATPRSIPVFICDVLALHDAGVHLFFDGAAMRRFLYTHKVANSYLVPFTKIPERRAFEKTEENIFFLPGVRGMPGRVDCDGLVKTAGIACVYGMLMCPKQATQSVDLSLPYGNADANIERCATLVRLYCAGETRSLQSRGASLITLAQRISPNLIGADNLMKGVADSIASFSDKITQLTRYLPRYFEDGSLALTE